MGSRFAKGLPEFVYFIGEGDGWVRGPFVKPQRGYKNRKFKLEEVPFEENTKKRNNGKLG